MGAAIHCNAVPYIAQCAQLCAHNPVELWELNARTPHCVWRATHRGEIFCDHQTNSILLPIQILYLEELLSRLIIRIYPPHQDPELQNIKMLCCFHITLWQTVLDISKESFHSVFQSNVHFCVLQKTDLFNMA